MSHIAAIDIGSNALRATIVKIGKNSAVPVYTFREPLRLGLDVFSISKISEKKMLYTEDTFLKLSKVFANYDVQDIKVLATSALRDAENSQELVSRIKKLTGLKIKTISGLQEAKLIYNAVTSKLDFKDNLVLLIDIGGGSTEITLVENHIVIASKSFDIGTLRLFKIKNLRMMETLIEDETFKIESYLRKKIKLHHIDYAVGTGGNLRRMGKLRKQILRKETDKVVSYKEIEKIYNRLCEKTYEERIRLFKMRPDRADVIIPATYIIKSILARLHTPRMLVPDIGLKEGIILSMIEK